MSEQYLVKGDNRIPLTQNIVIGRSDECDLQVAEGHPSRRHAQITIEDDGVWLEDLSSANGTFVNDHQITEKVLLQNGDHISFDIDRFIFEAEDTVADDATVIRRLPESDATVVRRIEPAEAAADEPAVVAEPPTPKPPAATSTSEPTPEPTPQPAPEPTPETPPEATPETTAQPQAATASAAPHVPRSWADPDYQNEQGTRMLTAEEMRAMASGGNAAAVEVSEPQLIITAGDNAGMSFPLGSGADGEWSIGTEANSDLQLTGTGISANHAKLTCENGRWRVIDQMSANGTFVNGNKSTVSFLSNGDSIKFGPVECTIALPAAGKKSKRAKAGSPAGKSAGKNKSWLIIAIAAAVTVGLLLVVMQFL